MKAQEGKPIKRRMTHQKQAILEYLRSVTSHPNASTLYEEMRKKMPKLSLGTIYRTLRVLHGEGLVKELPYEDFSRYDGRTDLHYHVLCLSCGRVSDAEVGREVADLTRLVRAPQFKVVGHRLEFLGYCSQCLHEAQ